MKNLFIAPRAGVWCRGLSGWQAFTAALGHDDEPDARITEPVPDLLPPREGRRAPLYVRLAIEAGAQACRENGVPVGEVATVFASSLGDIQVTDYMCRALAEPAPMLSPTRFHNSVHNAASGYWTIGAENRLPSTAVAAHEFTFTAALLEAATIAGGDGDVVLLIAHDVPTPVPLDSVCRSRQSFAAGVLLCSRKVAADWRPLAVQVKAGSASWPDPANAWLRHLALENDSARACSLLESLAAGGGFSQALPVNDASHVVVTIGR